MSWDQALAQCRRRGGSLAIPINSAENRGLAAKANAKGLRVPWIGVLRYRLAIA